MNILKTLLTDRTIEEFSIDEHGYCLLQISGGYSMREESLLRFVGNDDEFLTSLDHKHKFGLPAPFDAEHAIREKIKGRVIMKVELTVDTNDVTFHLDNGRIEIICTSAGYEAYQLNGPDNFFCVGRGGRDESPWGRSLELPFQHS